MAQDVEKKMAFLGSQPRGGAGEAVPGLESIAHDVDTVKYDLSELKDSVHVMETPD